MNEKPSLDTPDRINIEQKLPIDLDNPQNYINREVSWLRFNLRVLREAGIKTLPVLERMKFLSICSSNLDEFFMIRVAGLWQQLDNGRTSTDVAGLTPIEQLERISRLAHIEVKLQYRYMYAVLKELDRQHGIHFARVHDLSETGKRWLDNFYMDIIYPVLTPMAIDASHPFPFLANQTLNLIIELINSDNEHVMSVVQVPSVLKRIVEIQAGCTEPTYVFLEDIIMHYCHHLFAGCQILGIQPFRITRNSDLWVDEEDTDNLLKEIEKSLRRRRNGDIIRLEISTSSNANMQKFLMQTLELDENDVFQIPGPLDLTCLMSFATQERYPYLAHPPFVPQQPQDLNPDVNIFEQISRKDILLHHPYESFEPIVKLINQAADDSNVLAIKQTLYRVGSNSAIVAALARAGENGKQVTVLVELKARFDEENNVHWAKKLEAAGCHVIYGLYGLKTHAKITLIVRRENSGIKRYIHLGTGNYNAGTAKLYTDMGLLTAKEQFGVDASAFFNMISGYCEPPDLKKLTIAPITLRKKIYALIEQEIEHVHQGKIGHMILKMNSLIDKGVMRKLYEASCAGVKIELIIRGICGIRPGITNVSENITVRSIIGRQLEHTRIFYFYNAGQEEVYLSSADLMSRNLNDRVEIMFPIDAQNLKQRIKSVLNLYLKDNVKAHKLYPNGTYRRVVEVKSPRIDAQEELYAMAKEKAHKPFKLSSGPVFKPIYHSTQIKNLPNNNNI